MESPTNGPRLILTLRGVGLAYLPSLPWLFSGFDFSEFLNFLAFPLSGIHLMVILILNAARVGPGITAALLEVATLPFLIWFAWRHQSIRAHLILMILSAGSSLFLLFLVMSVPT